MGFGIGGLGCLGVGFGLGYLGLIGIGSGFRDFGLRPEGLRFGVGARVFTVKAKGFGVEA